ncbi:MAG TPA: YceD family protein [Streptosporangiaceae bacterium]
MPNTYTNAPRGALVFDMRSLSRQAGSARERKLTVPAPEDLRLELVGVPAGAGVELDLRFEAVSEGVLVTGFATAPLAGECARCLAPLASTVTASFTELYLYDDERRHGSREAHDGRRGHDKHDKHDRLNQLDKHDEQSEQDDEERYLDSDLLDLEPAFRDAVVLALPMSPLCRDDCPGLCVECGVPLADAGPGHRHEDAPDPRWAALKQLDGQTTTQPGRRAGAIDLQEG